VIARYSKALGALLGALTPAAVIAILATVDVHIPATLAAGICTVCGTIATIAVPANKTGTPAAEPASTATPPAA
jgi:hypothetical protein